MCGSASEWKRAWPVLGSGLDESRLAAVTPHDNYVSIQMNRFVNDKKNSWAMHMLLLHGELGGDVSGTAHDSPPTLSDSLTSDRALGCLRRVCPVLDWYRRFKLVRGSGWRREPPLTRPLLTRLLLSLLTRSWEDRYSQEYAPYQSLVALATMWTMFTILIVRGTKNHEGFQSVIEKMRTLGYSELGGGGTG